MLARILALLFLVTPFIFTTPSFAQDIATTSTDSTTLTTNPLNASPAAIPATVSPTSSLYTDLLLHNMMHTLSCFATGESIIAQPCLTYQVTKNAQGTIQSMPVLSKINLSGGALGVSTSLIGTLLNTPPIRTADYLASVGQGLGIVKTANAQVAGSGAQILNPILKLWQVSRNISYILIIIIFLVIGLMIVFRNKINPQTVISAQAALPGLIIGLVMITFSYFFAALIVDTAFLGTNLVGAYFSAAQGTTSGGLTEELKNQNVLSIMSTFVGSIGQGDLHGAVSDVIDKLGTGPKIIITTFASFLSYQYASQFGEIPATVASAIGCSTLAITGTPNLGILAGIPQMTWSNVPNCIVNTTIIGKQAAGAIAASAALTDASTVVSWALYIILIAILIYTMFKLLFRLINSFISIIFYTIFAPFIFLVSSLPGRQGIATGWFLNLLANILAFPAIIGVFYFVNYLFGSQTSGLLTGQPPFQVTGGPLDLAGYGTLPLFSNMGINFIRIMLAYGLLLATPTIPDLIVRAIGKAGQAGQMIGQEIGGATRSGRQYVGQYGSGMQQFASGIGGQRQWSYQMGKGFGYFQSSPSIIRQLKGAKGELETQRTT